MFVPARLLFPSRSVPTGALAPAMLDGVAYPLEREGVPAKGRRVLVNWARPQKGQPSGQLSGEVIELRKLLDGNKVQHSFKVKYDLDSAECWHDEDDVWQYTDEAGSCDRGWVRINAICSISHQPLTEPAKTEGCKHLAKCNRSALAALIGPSGACPDCGAALKRKRDLVPDVPMRDALGRASPSRFIGVGQSQCGHHLRLQPPSPTAAASIT